MRDHQVTSGKPTVEVLVIYIYKSFHLFFLFLILFSFLFPPPLFVVVASRVGPTWWHQLVTRAGNTTRAIGTASRRQRGRGGMNVCK